MSFKGVFTQAANLAEKKECHTLSIDLLNRWSKLTLQMYFQKHTKLIIFMRMISEMQQEPEGKKYLLGSHQSEHANIFLFFLLKKKYQEFKCSLSISLNLI